MSSQTASAALGFLLPTCWEIEVTCAAAMILVALYAAFELLAPRPSSPPTADDLTLARDLDAADKVTACLPVPPSQISATECARLCVLIGSFRSAVQGRLQRALGVRRQGDRALITLLSELFVCCGPE
jgi:hypothetical protein